MSQITHGEVVNIYSQTVTDKNEIFMETCQEDKK